MSRRKRKITIWLIVVLLLLGGLTTVYLLREKIVGQYVPEVTHFRSAQFNWVNDSLIGSVTLELKNKSTSKIIIDSLSASLQLDSLNFVDIHQDMHINLNGLEDDTISLAVNIPIEKFLRFIDSKVNQDSVSMTYSLVITYDTKVGHVNLPIKKTINIPAPRKILSQIVKFDYQSYKDKTAYGDLYLYIYNPGRINARLSDIRYSFSTSGHIFTNGKYRKDIHIVPGEETMTIIPVALEIEKPLKTVTNVIGNNDQYYFEMQLNGRLRTKSDVFDGCRITLNKSGNFELYQKDKEEKPEKEKKPKKSEKGIFRKKESK